MKIFALIVFTFNLWLFAAKDNSKAPEITNITLINEKGSSFKTHDFKGSYLFVSFIFSRCPMANVCPLTLELNKKLLTAWRAKMPGKKIKLLLVTLDPLNDSPKALLTYGKSHGLNFNYFVLATGSEKAVNDFASDFNVIAFPSGDSLTHNSKSILIGPDLRPIKEYRDNEWTPEQILKDSSL